MTGHYLILAVYTIIAVVAIHIFTKNKEKNQSFNKHIFFVGIFIAMAIRIFFALGEVSFETDTSSFMAWGEYIYSGGINEFYSHDIFLDYPPLYMLVLYIIRALAQLFSIPTDGAVYAMLLKLTAIMGDMGCGYLIYIMTKKEQGKDMARLLSTIFILCPAVIYNSSVWGQVDSVLALFIGIALYMIYKKKTVMAAFFYALAILTKTQAILFGPIFLYYILERKSIKEFLKATCSGVFFIWVALIPFSKNIWDITWFIKLYFKTFGGYKYFTVNACNIYMLADLNWAPLSNTNGGWINFLVISLTVAIAGLCYFKIKGDKKIFLISSIFLMTIFTFSTMMHERYVFAAILLLAIYFGITKKMEVFYGFLIVSGVNYLNCVSVLKLFWAGYSPSKAFFTTLSIINLAVFVFMVYFLIKLLLKQPPLDFFNIKKEVLIVSLLTVVYAIFAFLNLGTTKVPKSYFMSTQDNKSFEFVFQEDINIASIYTYMGMGEQNFGNNKPKINSDFEIYQSLDGVEYAHLTDITSNGVFKWKKQDINVMAKYLKFVAKADNQVLNEIIFTDENNTPIYPQLINYDTAAEYPATSLVDEQDTWGKDESYYYSMYFDEIYHGRTAYEQINDYTIYETTHPPLGKTIISMGIMLFGMSPFGFRFMGALSGVLMIPIIYILAKKILKSFYAAFAVALLLAVDFMHITQTRIATVDTFLVLFTLLTFLFMVLYSHEKFEAANKKQFIYLVLSGVFMGCTVAVKWNGAYAMIGLGIFFFYALYKKYTSAQDKLKARRLAFKTIAFCIVAFVIVPFMIYAASFLAVIDAQSIGDFFINFARWQKNMFSYHSGLVAEHFYASKWYTWPLVIKPVWYAIANTQGGTLSSIAAFGNPFIWWLTLPMAVGSIWVAYKRKAYNLLIIPIGYITSFLPWIAITRLSFIYHYFPSAIFGIIAIGIVIDYIIEKYPQSKGYINIYLIACIVLFFIFLPVTTGISAPRDYILRLQWLSSWHFSS